MLFNFIAAVVIYIGMAWHWGENTSLSTMLMKDFDFVPEAIDAGFRTADIPLSADGRRLDASDSDWMLALAEAKSVTVLRNHRDTVEITLPDDFIFRINRSWSISCLPTPGCGCSNRARRGSCQGRHDDRRPHCSRRHHRHSILY